MTAELTTVVRRFRRVVNMTPRQLEHWLQTAESWRVGAKQGARSESTGHRSGRQIVGLLEKKQAELEPDDIELMEKVVSHIKRRLAQRPEGDVRETSWRWSLMNWGHDPLKSNHRPSSTRSTKG